MLRLFENEHGVCFHYIKGKFITFEPVFNLCKGTVDFLIELSDIKGLMADVRVISFSFSFI